jgi:hypothetical protein
MLIVMDTKFYSTELIMGHIIKVDDGHWIHPLETKASLTKFVSEC